MNKEMTILKLFTMKEILENNPDYFFSPAGNLVIKQASIFTSYFDDLGTELKVCKDNIWPSWAIERDLGW